MDSETGREKRERRYGGGRDGGKGEERRGEMEEGGREVRERKGGTEEEGREGEER